MNQIEPDEWITYYLIQFGKSNISLIIYSNESNSEIIKLVFDSPEPLGLFYSDYLFSWIKTLLFDSLEHVIGSSESNNSLMVCSNKSNGFLITLVFDSLEPISTCSNESNSKVVINSVW